MSNIAIHCQDQILTLVETPEISSGDVNYDGVTFTFCNNWEGFIKTAVFYNTKEHIYEQILDANNSGVIPKEVLMEPGYFYIGVFGVKDEEVITSNVLKYRVVEGVPTADLEQPDPNPDVLEQILSDYNTTKTLLETDYETVKADLQADYTEFTTTVTEAIEQSETDIGNKVNTSDIIDNLTSTDATKPLSAKRGKVLNDTKFNSLGTSYNFNIDTLQQGITWANGYGTVTGTAPFTNAHYIVIGNNINAENECVNQIAINTAGGIKIRHRDTITDAWQAWTEGLGFTAVQQGGGTGQGTNAIKIGWASDGAGVKATVDITDIGYFLANGSNVKVLETEVVIASGATSGYVNLNYPGLFTKANCIVMSAQCYRSSKWWNMSLSFDAETHAYPSPQIALGDEKINVVAYGVAGTYPVKVVLFRYAS